MDLGYTINNALIIRIRNANRSLSTCNSQPVPRTTQPVTRTTNHATRNPNLATRNP